MTTNELHAYVAAHQPLTGRVWSGTQSSYWYNWLHERTFAKLLGGRAVEGSLNVWFTQEYRFRHPVLIRAKAERWSKLYVQSVIVSKDGRKFAEGLALRRGAKDSRAWMEIFAKVRRLKYLKLRDNDLISVWMR